MAIRQSTITDIHAHVLPDIDDGPANQTESHALLNAMTASGIHRVIVTPHYNTPYFENPIAKLDTAFREFTALRSDAAAPELVLGAEVRLGRALIDDIRSDSVPTLGDTQYVLIEFPTVDFSDQLFQLIHELRVRDYRVILAHPERYAFLQKSPDRIDEVLALGVDVQITAQCFVDDAAADHAPIRLAWAWLAAGKAALIASDAHNTRSRAPLLVEAYDNIEHRLGTACVQQLIDNANAVWEGDELTSVSPTTLPKESKGRFWFRR